MRRCSFISRGVCESPTADPHIAVVHDGHLVGREIVKEVRAAFPSAPAIGLSLGTCAASGAADSKRSSRRAAATPSLPTRSRAGIAARASSGRRRQAVLQSSPAGRCMRDEHDRLVRTAIPHHTVGCSAAISRQRSCSSCAPGVSARRLFPRGSDRGTAPREFQWTAISSSPQLRLDLLEAIQAALPPSGTTTDATFLVRDLG